MMETTERRVETRAERRVRLLSERIVHSVNIRAGSSVKSVGQYIVIWCKDHPGQRMQMRMVGAGAVNQAVKSVAHATPILQRQYQLDLIVRMGFTDGSPNEHGVVPSVVVLTLEALS